MKNSDKTVKIRWPLQQIDFSQVLIMQDLCKGIGKYTKKGTQICFRTIENRIAELRKRLPDPVRLLRRKLRLYPAPEGKEKFPGIKKSFG